MMMILLDSLNLERLIIFIFFCAFHKNKFNLGWKVNKKIDFFPVLLHSLYFTCFVVFAILFRFFLLLLFPFILLRSKYKFVSLCFILMQPNAHQFQGNCLFLGVSAFNWKMKHFFPSCLWVWILNFFSLWINCLVNCFNRTDKLWKTNWKSWKTNEHS